MADEPILEESQDTRPREGKDTDRRLDEILRRLDSLEKNVEELKSDISSIGPAISQAFSLIKSNLEENIRRMEESAASIVERSCETAINQLTASFSSQSASAIQTFVAEATTQTSRIEEMSNDFVAQMRSVGQSAVETFDHVGVDLLAKMSKELDTASGVVSSLANGATNDISAAISGFNRSVDSKVMELNAQTQQTVGELSHALSTHVETISSTLLETVDVKLSAFNMAISSLLQSVSMSYLEWVSNALNAAGAKLDASLMARDLSTAVDGLEDSLLMIADLNRLLEKLKAMEEKLDGLLVVYAGISPHLDAFSTAAQKMADTSYTRILSDVSASLVNLKQLAGKKGSF